MNPSVPLAEYPAASPFTWAYAGDFARVAPWFAYDPHRPGCFAERLAELDARPAQDKRELAEAVAGQQRRFGTGQLAVEAALALGEPGTYTVVCGQQAGLFGGPLYTQLKAINAIKLARELARQFPGRRFVPLFWISTEDSDYDEVRRTWFIGQDGHLLEAGLPPAPPEDEGVIVSARNVRAELDELLGQLAELLPGGLHRDDVLAAVREDYGAEADAAGGPLCGGFARWMARLFRGTELVLLDPQDPRLKPLGLDLIERELRQSAEIEAALSRRNAEIARSGFQLQVTSLPGDTDLFLLDERKRRLKIARDGAGFALRQSGEHFGLEQLLAVAATQPERFVAGVMLRPLYQDSLFPPAAFLGGGAELAYRAQCGAVFETLGQRMAPAFHRATATLLPARSAELLDEMNLRLVDCYRLPQDLAGLAVAQDLPREIERALERYRDLLFHADHDLEELAVSLDPALKETFSTLRGNLERHIEKLEKKVISSLKQKHQNQINRLGLVQRQICPNQSPQERVLPLLHFLPRYGFQLVEKLLAEVEAVSWSHHTIILD